MSKQTKQTKQTKQAPARKQRNTLLTIALAIVLLHGLLMFAIFWTVRPETERAWTNIAVWLMIFSAVGDIVAAAAMWYWKRWGIYSVRGSRCCFSHCGRDGERRSLPAFRRAAAGDCRALHCGDAARQVCVSE
jgi:hypothetical protein